MPRTIKVFSHNDLDGFGAPYLLKAVQPTMFSETTFEIEPIGAGRIDDALAQWLRDPAASQCTDVYIMDMTPDNDYTIQQLDRYFANHWLIFDHHDSEAEMRQKYRQNVVTSSIENPSAVSIVWEWLQSQDHFDQLASARQTSLAEYVEAIRSYDTWDWQNDPDMAAEVRQMADELDQLFWFYPLDYSAAFIEQLLATDWATYRHQNELLITTLNERRSQYLKHHLKDVVEARLDGHTWAIVYANDYKSEIGHQVLKDHPDAQAAMVVSPKSISFRSNGELDVAAFAEKYFHGGGHEAVAGARIDFNLIEVGEKALVEFVRDTVENHQEEVEATNETLADTPMGAQLAKLAEQLKKQSN